MQSQIQSRTRRLLISRQNSRLISSIFIQVRLPWSVGQSFVALCPFRRSPGSGPSLSRSSIGCLRARPPLTSSSPPPRRRPRTHPRSRGAAEGAAASEQGGKEGRTDGRNERDFPPPTNRAARREQSPLRRHLRKAMHVRPKLSHGNLAKVIVWISKDAPSSDIDSNQLKYNEYNVQRVRSYLT